MSAKTGGPSPIEHCAHQRISTMSVANLLMRSEHQVISTISDEAMLGVLGVWARSDFGQVLFDVGQGFELLNGVGSSHRSLRDKKKQG